MTGSTADMWTTTTANDYDPRRVVTQAYDTTAKTGRQMTCRVTTAMGDAVDFLVERIPHMRSSADVIRTAIYHYMHYINSLDENDMIFAPLEQQVRQAEVNRMNGNMADWDALINSLNDLLGRLVTEGDYETAQHLLDMNVDHEYMTLPFQMRMSQMLNRHAEQIRYRMPQPDTGNHD